MENDFYWFWLCNISGIGCKKIKAILDYFHDAKSVYHAGKSTFSHIKGLYQKDIDRLIKSKDDVSIYDAFEKMRHTNIQFVHIKKDTYPSKLRELYDAPACLYVRGRLPNPKRVSVAIIGARNCTEYGKNVASILGEHFAHMGIQVISGMAAGIDTAGHKGCLAGDGYTCAVLGCGVDICYPSQNIELFSNIIQNGGVLSEYPMGTKPIPSNFPVRNRIISGLADVIIVVEARKKSGSLITVDLALEQNKEVMAVPGRIGDVLSEGCNELIKQGAMVLTNPNDIKLVRVVEKWIKDNETDKMACRDFIEMGFVKKDFIKKDSVKNKCEKVNVLASEKNMLYSLLGLSPISLEEIVRQSGLDIPRTIEVLLELQLNGYIKEVGQNCYIRNDL